MIWWLAIGEWTSGGELFVVGMLFFRIYAGAMLLIFSAPRSSCWDGKRLAHAS
jgi:hypothetical protein